MPSQENKCWSQENRISNIRLYHGILYVLGICMLGLHVFSKQGWGTGKCIIIKVVTQEKMLCQRNGGPGEMLVHIKVAEQDFKLFAPEIATLVVGFSELNPLGCTLWKSIPKGCGPNDLWHFFAGLDPFDRYDRGRVF